MKYLYSPEQKSRHTQYLQKVGGIASGIRSGRGPKAPPNHTAKSTSEKRFGRNKHKCDRYRAEGRREARKTRNVALQARKKMRAERRRLSGLR